jgi:DNA-binding transcriptional MerR regulator
LDHKAPEAFRSISEVADELDLPQHVLRFWESRFRDIKPMKRGGGRRYYRPDDVNLLRGIRHLLYGEGYTIRGVQRILREQGAKFVAVVWQEGAPQPPHGATDDEDLADEAISVDAEGDDESGGLRGRLTSLIGRDLGERDDVEARREPPLKSAPEPRIEPTDRAVYSAGGRRPDRA